MTHVIYSPPRPLGQVRLTEASLAFDRGLGMGQIPTTSVSTMAHNDGFLSCIFHNIYSLGAPWKGVIYNTDPTSGRDISADMIQMSY